MSSYSELMEAEKSIEHRLSEIPGASKRNLALSGRKHPIVG